MDREKVIKGLECCHNKNRLWQHDQCPYHGFDKDCESNLYADAIALIDTQYKLILELQNLISIGTKMMNDGEVE